MHLLASHHPMGTNMPHNHACAYCCIFQAAWRLEAACVFQKRLHCPCSLRIRKSPAAFCKNCFFPGQSLLQSTPSTFFTGSLVMRSVPAQRLPSRPCSYTRNIHRESHALHLQTHNRSAWIRYPSPIVKTDR